MPRAALNWILFDEQFRVVQSTMGFKPVTTSGEVEPLNTPEIEMTKSGYLYIYCSNESSTAVFFDNIQVVHERSRVLEETHYYPFGLTIRGISGKSSGGIENMFKFNGGTELNRDFDINLYETAFRSYDPQIGRFHQIDPMADLSKSWTPFAFGSNNPILRNDQLGLKDTTINGETMQRDKDLPAVVHTHIIPSKKPQSNTSSPSLLSLPYSETTSVLLDRSVSRHAKLDHLRNITPVYLDPAASRKLDGALLKGIVSKGLLNLMNKVFIVIEIANVSMTMGKGSNGALAIPYIGGIADLMLDDFVASSDEITFNAAISNGYVHLARFLNSGLGKRSGLVGVYANKETMEAILANGGLDIRLHNVLPARGAGYPDNPNDNSGNKVEYFILFRPNSTPGAVTNFGVMPIR